MSPSGILTYSSFIQKREENRKQFCNTDLSRFLSASFCKNFDIALMVDFFNSALRNTEATTTSLSVFLYDEKADVICARCSFPSNLSALTAENYH